MTLVEQRILFSRLLGRLLMYATETTGIAVAVDQVKRTQAEAAANAATGKGILHSLHTIGLAADLLCYRMVGGVWVYLAAGNEPEYAMLGQHWKSLHALCAWGGDFKKPDPNHYSVTRDGVR